MLHAMQRDPGGPLSDDWRNSKPNWTRRRKFLCPATATGCRNPAGILDFAPRRVLAGRSIGARFYFVASGRVYAVAPFDGKMNIEVEICGIK